MAAAISSNILNLLATAAQTVIPPLDAPREDVDGLNQDVPHPDHLLAGANRLQGPCHPNGAAKEALDLQWSWLFLGLLIVHNGADYLLADRLAAVSAGRGLSLLSPDCTSRW